MVIEKEGTKFVAEFSVYEDGAQPDVATMEAEFKLMLGCTSTCMLEMEASKDANIYLQQRRKRKLGEEEDMFTKWTLEVSIFEEDPEYDELVEFIDKGMTRFMKECSTTGSKFCPSFVYADPDSGRGGFWFNMIKDVTFYVYVAPPPPPYVLSAAHRMSSVLAAVVAPLIALLAVRL